MRTDLPGISTNPVAPRHPGSSFSERRTAERSQIRLFGGRAGLSTPPWTACLLLAAAALVTACSVGQPTPIASPSAVEPTATATPEPTPTATPLLEDVHEPNDSMFEASGPLTPGEEYQGFIAAKDDIDFFYLELDSPQVVELYLTDIPPNADYDLYLVTGEEDLLADSSNTGEQDEHILYTTSSVGVFYVVVLPFDNFSDRDPYTLGLSLAPAPTPSGQDNYEPNDTFAQATGPISLGQRYQSYIWDEGDVDIYAFQIDQFRSVTVSLTEITSVADYDLFLYSAAEELLASSELMIDRETVQQGLPAGTYYAVVRSLSGFSQNDPYTLQIDAAGG
jgi:hypothetical protein